MGTDVKFAYLSLGSNMGDRLENLRRALSLLPPRYVSLVKTSAVYETEPRDVVEQPWFYNLVAECEVSCFPLQLLSILQGIEGEVGRTREKDDARGGPRVIDIDVLLFGDVTLGLPQLTIPHPRMRERRFVLEPLIEIAPELRDTTTGGLLRQLLPAVSGQAVRRVASL